jgi:hypothetical protein
MLQAVKVAQQGETVRFRQSFPGSDTVHLPASADGLLQRHACRHDIVKAFIYRGSPIF